MSCEIPAIALWTECRFVARDPLRDPLKCDTTCVEYLTEEIRRGGIQLPQEETQQTGRVKTGREEEEEEDRETEKRREWDE
jgi:hypothetical protein